MESAAKPVMVRGSMVNLSVIVVLLSLDFIVSCASNPSHVSAMPPIMSCFDRGGFISEVLDENYKLIETNCIFPEKLNESK